jgi:3-oxoacyl-[acyl-carrier-protein] synthase II
MNMNRRVVITGMGWITPLGHEIEAVWKRLLAGESGINKTTNFDAATFPTTFSAEVQNFDVKDFLGERYPDHATCSRNSGFALAAAELAWKAAGLNGAAGVDTEMVGVYLGAGEGPIDFDNFSAAALVGWQEEQQALDAVAWTRKAYEVLDAVREFEQDPNCAAGHIAYRFNAQGPNLNTLTACAASTQALGEAARLISRGDTDIMISGGAHSMIHPLGVTGFNLLTALSNRNDDFKTASRPFDATRDGFVLGEGAGILILEEYEAAKKRGAPLLAEIIGYGSTADAFRVTDMHDEGQGGSSAMQAALRKANLEPQDIDYISAHGTGTGENDKIESRAIGAVFGKNPPPISSVKSMLGHLIAGAGAVELITCVLAMRDSIIPPTMNYRTPDSNCPFDYVPNEARPAELTHVLSNSFGFGGQNDTIVIRKIAS